MKAPTTDYSQLASSLSAKSGALQAVYSAKDSRNWKDRYKIQQQSLDLQGEAIKDSKAQTWTNFGLGMANLALDTTNKFLSYYQANDTNNFNTHVNNQASQIENYLNGQSALGIETSNYVKNTDGTYSWQLTEQAKKDLSTIIDDGMSYKFLDKNIQEQGRTSLWQGANALSLSKSAELVQNNALQGLQNNYNSLMDYAVTQNATNSLNDDDITIFQTKDSKTEYKLPTTVFKLIDSQEAFISEENKDKLKMSASEEFKERTEQKKLELQSQANQDACNIINNAITTISTDGNFFSYTDEATKRELKVDEDKISSIYSIINNAVDNMHFNNDAEKKDFKDKCYSQVQSTMRGVFSNMRNANMDANGIMDATFNEAFMRGLNGDTDDTGNHIQETGALNAIFYDKDGNAIEEMAGFRTSLIDEANQYQTQIITAYGEQNSAIIQEGFSYANTKFNNGEYSNNIEFANDITKPLRAVYGEDWQTNTEALSVFLKGMETYIPKDVLDDPEFSVAWQAFCSTGLKEDYSKMSSEKKLTAQRVLSKATEALTKELIKDPSIAVDSEKQIRVFTDLLNKYGKDYIDALDKANEGTNGKIEEAEKTTKTIFNNSSIFTGELVDGKWNTVKAENVDNSVTASLSKLNHDAYSACFNTTDPEKFTIKDEDGNEILIDPVDIAVQSSPEIMVTKNYKGKVTEITGYRWPLSTEYIKAKGLDEKGTGWYLYYKKNYRGEWVGGDIDCDNEKMRAEEEAIRNGEHKPVYEGQPTQGDIDTYNLANNGQYVDEDFIPMAEAIKEGNAIVRTTAQLGAISSPSGAMLKGKNENGVVDNSFYLNSDGLMKDVNSVGIPTSVFTSKLETISQKETITLKDVEDLLNKAKRTVNKENQLREALETALEANKFKGVTNPQGQINKLINDWRTGAIGLK